jgi:hypothetical protein
MSSEKVKPILETYGLQNVIRSASQLDYDRYAFAFRLPTDIIHMTRVQLFQRIAERLLPKYFEWHDWTMRMLEALCNERWIGFSGCSGSAKTHNVAGFSVVWWLCLPEQSSVTYCSTTKEMLRKRAWANIQAAHWTPNLRNIGNMVDSRMTWQVAKGDSKHSISGVAVEDGSVDKVAENLKGIHTLRQMLVIDEANKIPRAIDDATANAYAYPSDAGGEFIEVKIANPMSKLDAFGLFCEPKDGWNSVSVDDDEWRSKPKYDGKTGIVSRFDALKSPNIVAGKSVSRHLPTKEQVDMAVKRTGSENDPLFWSNKRGFWPPEGITQTVFSESLLAASRCRDTWLFIGPTFMVAGFDPAFSSGGDRAIFRAARCGQVEGGYGIQLMPIEVVPLNAAAVDKAGIPIPLSYQLVEGLRRLAALWRVPPENILMDTTGEGGAIADIAAREWSPDILRCEFSSKASDQSVSHEDTRLCINVYKNMATQLWFTGREFFNAGQVRGIDSDTASQLCNRTYTPEEAGRKRAIESKKEMKLRLSGNSPDEADGTLLCTEAARIRGLEIKPLGLTSSESQDFERECELAVQAITEDLYEEDSIPA